MKAIRAQVPSAFLDGFVDFNYCYPISTTVAGVAFMDYTASGSVGATFVFSFFALGLLDTWLLWGSVGL